MISLPATPTFQEVSTIQPDKKAIAQLAVDRLIMRIGSSEPVPGVELKVAHRLVARQSTIGP